MSFIQHLPSIAAGLILAAAGAHGAGAQSPIPASIVTRGTLSFNGRATVGDFTGTTHRLSGELLAAPDLASARGWVEAPVATLKTGKSGRDADLLKTMEADRYPMIRYELLRVTPGPRVADTTAVMLHGRFVIHGVTREADVPGHVVFGPGEFRVEADTPLNLTDYRIRGLSRMLGVLRMHERIVVHIDVRFGHDQTDGPVDRGA